MKRVIFKPGVLNRVPLDADFFFVWLAHSFVISYHAV
jgi:hypothetical protein